MPPKSNPVGPAGKRVAATVAAIRQARGISKTTLSSHLARLGRPMSIDVITNIEAGTRAVDLDDLLALARALIFPPILLIFPVGQHGQCELLPGDYRDTWRAVQWFTGDQPYTPDPDETEREAFKSSAAALEIYREYDDYVRKWRKAIWDAKTARMWGETMKDEQRGREMEQMAIETAKTTERWIMEVRTRMLELGYPPPELPRETEVAEQQGIDPDGR